jgi:proline racemase
VVAAVFTEPVTPGSHAGLMFMDADGYPTLSGHAAIAVTRVAIERRLVVTRGDNRQLVFDTVAGPIHAVDREHAVSITLVPAFVLHPGVAVNALGRHLRVDVACCGNVYAIVDGESAGLAVTWSRVPELGRAGAEVARAIDNAHVIAGSGTAQTTGIDGVVFTASASDAAASLRAAAVTAGGRVERSASGSAAAAVMAVLDAMGLMADTASFVQESITGSQLTARITGRTMVGERPAVVPEIEASAWITGEHAFVLDDDDPLKNGFPP